ncbi:ATP-binding protein [Nocardia sp. alder85J]|uniref:sensor histidine kinase n=1 Tax=Nocardia sp. alder85J TaxID=2862949 RepID=UPI001CD4783C|nr:ATP-binding protein [Nocardia sp. alder85J]MCX4095561.1 nitrate- and nitrite sensing domain-containing protein [Nocardia sp. alder85J]
MNPLRGQRFRTIGIRTRVLAIALVPSAALLLTASGTVTVLTVQAYSAQQLADYRKTVIAPLLRFIGTVQDERGASLLAVTGAGSQADLPGTRQRLDLALAETARISAKGASLDRAGISRFTTEFGNLVARLPDLRRSVDQRQAGIADVDSYYTRMIAAIADGGRDSSVHSSPSNDALAAEITGTALVLAADNHSRAVGLLAAGLAADDLDQAQRRSLTQLLGSYRNALESTAPQLLPSVEADYHALTGGPDWRLATAAEDQIADTGNLSLPNAQWQAAEQAVGGRLGAMLDSQYHRSADRSAEVAARSFTRSVLAGGALLIVTLAALAAALTLASRLVRRLRTLRTASLELAQQRLPEIIDRIRRGEEVDTAAAAAVVDSGGDEIGEVSAAFAVAQRAAIDGAVAEARTREGFNRVFLDIAFRSQALVRRQLDVLDVAESEQADPAHLRLLYRLDHLATRARRNAENLLILGGRQPGRRWREPVLLEDVVRSAVSETEGFTRVTTVRLPEVGVLGAGVADLIHLLAELIDNAASFSPPDAPILVHGSVVAHGLAVEITDQGLGIAFDEREQLNRLLCEPPEFHEMALSGRRRLGMFVIGQLARRHEISVRLNESAYGGVTAVVLLPRTLLHRTDTESDHVETSRTTAEFVTTTVTHRLGAALGGPDRPGSGGAVHALPPLFPDPAAEIGKPPLPRRSRQQSLAPQLAGDQVVADTAVGPARTADAARASMAALQRGTRRAHASDADPHR